MSGFVRDVVTILRKELLELVGSRKTARGPIVQASMVVVIAGILVPMSGPVVWTDVRASALLFYIFPATLAASVAADSFAGERERRTLETLLTTPLSDAAILVGKVATAVTFALATAAAALLAGLVTVNAHRAGGLYVPPSAFLLGIGGAALASALTTASLAVAISLHVTVARSAQQLSAVVTLVVVGAVATALKQLALTLDWALILRIDLALAAVGVASLVALFRVFRRDRLLENR
ncbi:MAG: ABC transporter permease [Polyangiales bacterium]